MITSLVNKTILISKHFTVADFACSSGVRQTGVKNSILISNFSRSLWIKTFTPRRTKDWVEAIEKVITGDPGTHVHEIEGAILIIFMQKIKPCITLICNKTYIKKKLRSFPKHTLLCPHMSAFLRYLILKIYIFKLLVISQVLQRPRK